MDYSEVKVLVIHPYYPAHNEGWGIANAFKNIGCNTFTADSNTWDMPQDKYDLIFEVDSPTHIFNRYYPKGFNINYVMDGFLPISDFYYYIPRSNRADVTFCLNRETIYNLKFHKCTTLSYYLPLASRFSYIAHLIEEFRNVGKIYDFASVGNFKHSCPNNFPNTKTLVCNALRESWLNGWYRRSEMEYWQDSLIPLIYSQAKVAVTNSVNDADLITHRTFEAMTVGIPVLHNNILSLKEFFVEGEDYIGFPNGDYAGMVLKVKEYLLDLKELERIGRNGQIKTWKYHMWEHRVKFILDCFIDNNFRDFSIKNG